MVEEIRKLVDEIKSEKGDLSLFLLLKNAPESGTWSVIVSAPWVDKIGQDKALDYLMEVFRLNVSKNVLSYINRIGFLRTDERIVNLLKNQYEVTEEKGKLLKDVDVGELHIDEGYLFEPRKLAQGA